MFIHHNISAKQIARNYSGHSRGSQNGAPFPRDVFEVLPKFSLLLFSVQPELADVGRLAWRLLTALVRHFLARRLMNSDDDFFSVSNLHHRRSGVAASRHRAAVASLVASVAEMVVSVEIFFEMLLADNVGKHERFSFAGAPSSSNPTPPHNLRSSSPHARDWPAELARSSAGDFFPERSERRRIGRPLLGTFRAGLQPKCPPTFSERTLRRPFCFWRPPEPLWRRAGSFSRGGLRCRNCGRSSGPICARR